MTFGLKRKGNKTTSRNIEKQHLSLTSILDIYIERTSLIFFTTYPVPIEPGLIYHSSNLERQKSFNVSIPFCKLQGKRPL